MVTEGNLRDILSEKGVESASFEAREILRFTDNEEEILKIAKLRGEGYPLQYIFGEWDFYDVTLKVGEGVLIPRQDTETLVDEALKLLKNKESPRLLDLCSGSGAIVIAIKNNKNGVYFALEKEAAAFSYLKENAEKYGGIEVINEDLFSDKAISLFSELDMITANPPYLTGEDMKSLQKEVEFEPPSALYGGEDGLLFYRFIANRYHRALKTGGHLLFEVGATQSDSVFELMKDIGYKNIYKVRDLSGIERVVVGEK